MPMHRQLWSVSSLTIELGIDRRTLSKKLSDLRPDGEGIEGGKTVRRRYLMHALKHLQAADRATAAEGQNVLAARSRLTRARARRAELEVAALERDLLPFDEVVQAWQQLVAAFRARCLALPAKLAPRLAMSETREIQAALTAAVREALQELSRFDLPRDRPGRPRVEPPAGGNGKSRPRRAAIKPPVRP
jgi:hypothetical protein